MKVYKQDDYTLKIQKYEDLVSTFHKFKADYLAATGMTPDTVELNPYDFRLINDYLRIYSPCRDSNAEDCKTWLGLKIVSSANKFVN